MPAFVPFVVGPIVAAGTRILAGQAARAAAAQGARAAAGQGARASASQGGKAVTRTAGRRTATTPKWASSGKKPRLTPTSARNRAQTARVRNKAPNAGKNSKNKTAYGTKGELRQDAMRQQLRESASYRRGQAIKKARAAKRKKRVTSLKTQAGITGASAVTYEAAKYRINQGSKIPTTTPIRPINWDPNRKRKK